MKLKFPFAAVLLVTAGVLAGEAMFVTQARAGETVTLQSSETRARPYPPSLAVAVRVDEPETLPAATELQDWLVDRLRRHRKRFASVASLEPHAGPEGVDFLLEIRLTHLSPYDEAPRFLLWRPIAIRGPGGIRALHSSQVPLQAQITITELTRGKVRSQTVITAQSTGRTITAGTTKPVAFLMGEKIMGHLKRASREAVFDVP